MTKKKEEQFGPQHFPVGTICEVRVGTCGSEEERDAQIVVVHALRKNGPNSYIIYTTQDLTVEGGCYNISWVTRIFERGPGPAVIQQHPSLATNLRDFFARTAEIRKPKSCYATYNLHELIYHIATDYVAPDQFIDLPMLYDLLSMRGIFIAHRLSVQHNWVVNKKKLHRAMRQLVNKCLRNPEQMQKQQDKEESAYCSSLFDEMIEDWDKERDERYAAANTLDVSTLEHVDDLLEYEGPLLSFYMKDGKCYLACWHDWSQDHDEHFWWVFEITPDQLGQYMGGKLSLLDAMRDSVALYSLVTAIDSNQIATRIEFSSIQEPYVPSKDSFFDAQFTRIREGA